MRFTVQSHSNLLSTTFQPHFRLLATSGHFLLLLPVTSRFLPRHPPFLSGPVCLSPKPVCVPSVLRNRACVLAPRNVPSRLPSPSLPLPTPGCPPPPDPPAARAPLSLSLGQPRCPPGLGSPPSRRLTRCSCPPPSSAGLQCAELLAAAAASVSLRTRLPAPRATRTLAPRRALRSDWLARFSKSGPLLGVAKDLPVRNCVAVV